MHKIFIKNLKNELNKHIKDSISVNIYNDILIVDILPTGSWTWHYAIKDISTRMLFGLESKTVAGIIVKKYTSYILSKHFK